jgi:hypothetical protein
MSEQLELTGYYFEIITYFQEEDEDPSISTAFVPCGHLSHEFLKSRIKKPGYTYENTPLFARIHAYKIWGEDGDIIEHDRIIEMNTQQCKYIWKWY